MTEAHITRSPADYTSPDQARNARTRAWAFVFDCWQKKEAAPESRPDDVKGSRNDSRRKTSIP